MSATVTTYEYEHTLGWCDRLGYLRCIACTDRLGGGRDHRVTCRNSAFALDACDTCGAIFTRARDDAYGRHTHGGGGEVKAWQVTVYRDEDGEASVESRTIGMWPTRGLALAAMFREVARCSAADPRWTDWWSATIDAGTREKRTSSEGWPMDDAFVRDEPGVRLSIGPTWEQEEVL